MVKKYQPVIGLEIHIELKTKTKMFCRCPADYFGKGPNTQVCPVCLGLPGALPIPNKRAIEATMMIGKALNCRINRRFRFERKHYFYPDLPKGYQISQYLEPIAVKGKVELAPRADREDNRLTTVKINRVHLEEDTAKLFHKGKETFIDFNRSGVALVEIVTEPDFDRSDEVKLFLEQLQVMIRYLGVSDADMEKGTMRLEPNISVRKLGIKEKGLPDYKVEIKNVNSFRFVKKAIDYEVKRQIKILERGEKPRQETRGFNEDKGVTYSQRTKEEAHDYRYFPEPDIPPFVYSKEELKRVFEDFPQLPEERFRRFVNQYQIRTSDAFILTRDKKLADYFEEVVFRLMSDKLIKEVGKKKLPQKIANLIVNKKISIERPINQVIHLIKERLGRKKVDDQKLNQVVERVFKANPKPVEDYRKGKKNALMFLVGQVMKEMKGKVEAKEVIIRLKKKLEGENI